MKNLTLKNCQKQNCPHAAELEGGGFNKKQILIQNCELRLVIGIIILTMTNTNESCLPQTNNRNRIVGIR